MSVSQSGANFSCSIVFLMSWSHEGGPMLDGIKPRSIFFSVSID